MRPTDHLQSLVSEDWQAATCHPFTDALAARTLEPEQMAGYLVQDYMFVGGSACAEPEGCAAGRAVPGPSHRFGEHLFPPRNGRARRRA